MWTNQSVTKMLTRIHRIVLLTLAQHGAFSFSGPDLAQVLIQ